MDPLTSTILAALVAGAAAGAAEAGKKAIVDAYDGLKQLIKTRFGAHSELAEAVARLESKPDSKGRQETLQEEVAAAQADRDAEILAAVNALRETLETHGGERVQTMLRSEKGRQTMRGRGGVMRQEMGDSPEGEQTME